jgi:hypothetical protein
MGQPPRFLRTWCLAAACAALSFLTFGAPAARADDTIKHPGDHPAYDFEVEPHGLLGWDGVFYDNTGFGLGVRFGIPIVSNGFVPTINNSVAISFGVDWLHYSCYGPFNDCSADYFEFPVTLQWNFYVSEHWSVFGEPGLFLYHDFFTSNCEAVGGVDCPARPNETSVLPAFYVGARYFFSDTVSLTMRLGYPTTSIGVSFFP